MNRGIRGALCAAAVLTLMVGAVTAANYMYEKASVRGVGYKNAEKIVSTQEGFEGTKLVEKTSGSGNIITDRTEIEAERQIGSRCGGDYFLMLNLSPRRSGDIPPLDVVIGFPGTIDFGPWGPIIYLQNSSDDWYLLRYRSWPTGFGPMDYINYTASQEFEYMPVSYQTGTYDQKWTEKVCAQNYEIGAVMTEMYTHAEHLERSTEVKTRLYNSSQNQFNTTIWTDLQTISLAYPPYPCCTGVLEAQINSNVIGVAHIGWLSRDPMANSKGRHDEYGRSVEDLTGVFSIEKFIQLWGNSTCGAVSVDWLPCV